MTVEASVAKLEAQQESMASDIHEMKSALSRIADTLQNLAGIEQRQVNLTDAITRAHGRIDDIQSTLKDEVKGHERMRIFKPSPSKHIDFIKGLQYLCRAVGRKHYSNVIGGVAKRLKKTRGNF